MSVGKTPADAMGAAALGFGAVRAAPHCADTIRRKIAAGVYHTPIVMEHVARAILQSGDLMETPWLSGR